MFLTFPLYPYDLDLKSDDTSKSNKEDRNLDVVGTLNIEGRLHIRGTLKVQGYVYLKKSGKLTVDGKKTIKGVFKEVSEFTFKD
jgi:cytoskeletal protein CcmA (bactofilin family)